MSRNPNTNYTYVYIFYPGDDVTEGRLRRLCGNDKITSVKVLTDADGKSSGLGFVGFKSKEDASQVSLWISYPRENGPPSQYSGHLEINEINCVRNVGNRYM